MRGHPLQWQNWQVRESGDSPFMEIIVDTK